MSRVLSVVLISSLALVVAGEVDYCSPEICSVGKHIACGHSGGFGDACPSNAKIEILSKSDINTILNDHNTLRNKIASGQEKGFSSAAKMSTLVREHG
jgi:hypothetical protein